MTLIPTLCEVSAEINGVWEMQLEHPIDSDGRWKYIQEESVVSAPTFVGENQLFRIYRVDKSDSGVKAAAYPIFFDAKKDCFLVDVRPTDKNGQDALNIMCAPNKKYSASSNIHTISTAYYIRKNLIEAINGDDENSFINRWGGEILFNNFKATINDRIGTDMGVQILYGKNLSGMSETIDTTEVITRIVPVAYNGYTLEGNAPWVDSPNISKYPTVYCRVVEFQDVKLAEDAQEDEESFPTLKELRAELVKRSKAMFLEGCDAPQITLDVTMVDLSKVEEYRAYKILENVCLGDTVHCRHNILDITTDARIISLTWDCIENKSKDLIIGDFETNYFDNVSSMANRVENAIRPDGTIIGGKIEGIIDGAKTQLRAMSSIAKKQEVRAILFEDLNTDSPTYGAMCLGTMGFQIAGERTKDGREWDWRTFGTGKGFFADLFVAGKIKSVDYVEGESGVLIDLDESKIISYSKSKAYGNRLKMELSDAGMTLVDLDHEDESVTLQFDTYGTQGVANIFMRSKKMETSLYVSPRGIQYSDFGSVAYGKINKGGISGTAIAINNIDTEKAICVGGLFGRTRKVNIPGNTLRFSGGILTDITETGTALTGKAMFSDNSWLEFKDGVLVGGKTTSGSIS